VILALACAQAAGAGAEDIALVTPTGTIHGTLLLPDTATPVPVILIIAGSGPTDRDGNSALLTQGNDSLKQLAEALASAGFASVRFDKRGIAESMAAGPQEADLRFEHYVEDATAWLAQLSDDARFSAVAVIGHSEGSLIGMLAVGQSGIPFISIAGPADDAATVIHRQLQGRLPPELAEANELILISLKEGQAVSDLPAPLASLYRPSVQPYMISWIRYDPSVAIAQLPPQSPCLILQGTTDVQVTWSDAEALHAANPACAMNIIGGMNHIMKAVPDDEQQQIASYSDPSLPLEPKLITAVVEFLQAATAPAP
jgi:pimeloyl-ACP methyl ester carboxylesterase